MKEVKFELTFEIQKISSSKLRSKLPVCSGPGHLYPNGFQLCSELLGVITRPICLSFSRYVQLYFTDEKLRLREARGHTAASVKARVQTLTPDRVLLPTTKEPGLPEVPLGNVQMGSPPGGPKEAEALHNLTAIPGIIPSYK